MFLMMPYSFNAGITTDSRRRGMNTVQPIRSLEDIARMKDTLREKNDKYYIMFTTGLNTGLRIGDVLHLHTSEIWQKSYVTITEQKTGKKRRFHINEPLSREIDAYINLNGLSGDDYLIQSRKGVNQPLSRVQAYRVLNSAAKEVGLDEIGTHTMRKTFGYWHYKLHKDIAVLQEILNHSTPSITLKYIGINEDIKTETLKNFFI
jgi:integrase